MRGKTAKHAVEMVIDRWPCASDRALGSHTSPERSGGRTLLARSSPNMEAQAPAIELPTLQLDVLQIVKDAQSLHGLKHSDYERYRRVGGLQAARIGARGAGRR